MKWASRSHVMRAAGPALVLVWLAGCVSGTGFIRHPYPKSAVDVPVSLAVGTVRTPEFPVIHDLYYIMLQADGRLPHGQMMCMMGLTHSPSERAYLGCGSEDPLLRADWTVWDADQVVSRGSSSLEDHAKWSQTLKIKIMGRFMGEAGKRYVVEVRFTKDGTPLDVANPHLIVVLFKYH